MKTLAIVTFLGSLCNGRGTFPNPPNWPNSVHVFKEGDINIQNTIDNASGDLVPVDKDCNQGQFSHKRVAFLFTPGDYSDVTVRVGYYMQVLGLGEKEQDTILSVQAKCKNSSQNVLDTFWRSAENFKSLTDLDWHVSQAAPLRRVFINGALNLASTGYSSGGYASDLYVEKHINFVSQQQFYIGNSHIHGRQNLRANWNTVFMGNIFDNYTLSSSQRVTLQNKSPKIAGKPFITASNGNFSLKVPPVKESVVGQTSDEGATTIDFSQVHVVSSDNTNWEEDLRQVINLTSTKAVLFTPGIYLVNDEITITQSDFVVLGIGMATLSLNSTSANHVLKIQGAKNVRVAGLLIDTSTDNSNATLMYVDEGSSNAIIQDVFFRVGGPVCSGVSAKTMLEVQSSDSIIDNTWAWRADHCVGGGSTTPNELHVKHGIVVRGDNNIGYGLASEHTLGHNLIWSGENGKSYFYQAEIAYGINQTWADQNQITGYKVDDSVTSHNAHGTGVYSFFRDHNVKLANGYQCPSGKEHDFFQNAFTLKLAGKGQIDKVVNTLGNPTTKSDQPYFL
mmetsp:Transcript_22585/g.49087  ORF Transcript_22585/g.49087 Transcript_22585/m.49087 type:complete len:563 (-) Transcript_22585:1094-2782(-)